MKKILFKIGIVLVVISIIVAIGSGVMLAYANEHIDYELDEELFKKAKEESTIYYYAYKNSELIEVWKSLGRDKREWTAIEYIPENLKNAFISMEDREFYSHKGINVKRTAAAVLNHIFKFRESFGASTITQQVVKNISGDNETTVRRKVNEIFRALHLEQIYSKDDILELYLNIAPMSGTMYGVGIAAETYFAKDVEDLTLVEAATIAGITNAPAKYDPFNNPDACKDKRNRVLYAMYSNGKISEDEYEAAKKEPLLISNELKSRSSSWFVETAREDVIKDLMRERGLGRSAASLLLHGAKIILTMNPDIQEIMENYFEKEENLSEKYKNGLNYSMVVTDPFSGNLLGIIGSAGKKSGESLFNYATSNITPGSVIKPLALYAPLIDSGRICWSDMFDDSPIRYNDDIPYPKNSPDLYDGMIDINDALKKSKNTVAIRLFNMLGAEKIFDNLTENFGFNLVRNGKNDNGATVTDLAEAPLALGQLSYGVSLRTITEAYNVFPNEGVLVRGNSYYCVLDKSGKEVLASQSAKKRIYDTSTAQVMNQLLMNVVADGTARQITLDETVDTAGKTGTSGKDRDRLFVGYTPYVTAGIWCGFADGRDVGVNNPSHVKIWDDIMKKIHNNVYISGYGESIKSFETGLLTVMPYCSVSGLGPTENCELDDSATIKYGYFTDKHFPNEKCEYH